jgi:hypothetical protein
VDVYIHIFLASALVGGVWSASRPDPFTPGERAPSTQLRVGRVGHRPSLDVIIIIISSSSSSSTIIIIIIIIIIMAL